MTNYKVKKPRTKLGKFQAQVLATIYNELDAGRPFPGIMRITNILCVPEKSTVAVALRALCYRYHYIKLRPDWVPNTHMPKYMVNPDENFNYAKSAEYRAVKEAFIEPCKGKSNSLKGRKRSSINSSRRLR